MNKETIEKAARKYATDKYGGENAKQYAIAQIHAGRDGFIDGAHWRINSVWHEGNEVPETNKRVLVCFEEVMGEFIYYRIRAFKPNVIKNWGKDNSCLDKVICWAYLDDLLPGRKEADND